MRKLEILKKDSTVDIVSFKLPMTYTELLQYLNKEFNSNDGTCIVYLDYKVLIGKYIKEKLVFYNEEVFEPHFIQKLRLFNLEKEIYLWRNSEHELKGRIRIDKDNMNGTIEHVDIKQTLWGTKSENLGLTNEVPFTKLTEDRGIELILPYNIHLSGNPKDRFFLETRNYIVYNELNQPEYGDYRFLSFLQTEKQTE